MRCVEDVLLKPGRKEFVDLSHTKRGFSKLPLTRLKNLLPIQLAFISNHIPTQKISKDFNNSCDTVVKQFYTGGHVFAIPLLAPPSCPSLLRGDGFYGGKMSINF